MPAARTLRPLKAALAAVLLAAAVPALADCPPKTLVQDAIYNADGTPAAGRVVIAWPTFRAGACQVVAGQVSVAVEGGSLSVELFPNEGATPAGTSYRVTYYLRSGRVSTEYWVVPAAAGAVTLAAVRSVSVPVPQVMFSQAQVTNLAADLARKLELPASCPAGKFLQTTGAAGVECADGTGAPAASDSVSGTVKTDAAAADPRVYLQSSVDELLGAKAALSHTHAAADISSGTLDPARLPAPGAGARGGVEAKTCSGSDKISAIGTDGVPVCSPDQTGGGGGGSEPHALLSATHTDTTAATVVRGDLIAGIGATPKWERLALGSAGTFLRAGASEPAWAAIAAGDLPNLENLNGTLTAAKGGTGANNTATAGRYLKGDGTNFVTSSGAASGTGSCTNQFVRALNSDAAPTCASVATDDLASAAVTPAKVSDPLKTRQVIFILGADNGAALADADDQKTIYRNTLGVNFTITEVWCQADAGTPSVNLQRNDGTPANILSSNLSCTTSGATGSLDATEKVVANGHTIDFVMVTAGGTAKRVTVVITGVIG